MKLTEIRKAMLTLVRDRVNGSPLSPTKTGSRALAWLCREGLVETTTNNPTAEPIFRITSAGRAALEARP